MEHQPIASEKIVFMRKIFFLDLKENPRGRFLKITEDVAGRRDTIMLPATAFKDFRGSAGTSDRIRGEALIAQKPRFQCGGLAGRTKMTRAAPRFRGAIAAAAMALTIVFATAQLDAAERAVPLHALLIGGGPDLANNGAEIESHLRFAARILPANAHRLVHFTNGKPRSRTVSFTDSAKPARAGERWPCSCLTLDSARRHNRARRTWA